LVAAREDQIAWREKGERPAVDNRRVLRPAGEPQRPLAVAAGTKGKVPNRVIDIDLHVVVVNRHNADAKVLANRRVKAKGLGLFASGESESGQQDRMRFDFVAGLGEIAIAIAIDVKHVAIEDEPDLRLRLNVGHDETVFGGLRLVG